MLNTWYITYLRFNCCISGAQMLSAQMGCAHFDMNIFHSLTDWPWPLRHILYNFTSKLLLVLSPGPGAKKKLKFVTLGMHKMRLLWNFHTQENQNWYTGN